MMMMMMARTIMIIIPFHDDDDDGDRDYYDHHPILLQRQGIRSTFVTTSLGKKSKEDSQIRKIKVPSSTFLN
jgi:hypothetical protein